MTIISNLPAADLTTTTNLVLPVVDISTGVPGSTKKITVEELVILGTGFNGSVGYTGSAGIDGIQGYTGSNGAYAAMGFVGSKGDAGGYTGSKGNIGFVGSKGDAGFYGSVGFTGSSGTGFTGYTGSASTNRGYTGSSGLGYTGSKSAGYIGSSGASGAYIPANAADWASPRPATVQSALDRMAALLKTLNSNTAIP